MKTNELRQKSQKELNEILGDGREKLRRLRFDLASGKIKNVREIRMIKKEIARLFTIINSEKHVQKTTKR